MNPHFYREKVIAKLRLGDLSEKLAGDDYNFRLLLEMLEAPNMAPMFGIDSDYSFAGGRTLRDCLIEDGPLDAWALVMSECQARRGPIQVLPPQGRVDLEQLEHVLRLPSGILAEAIGYNASHTEATDNGAETRAIEFLGLMNTLADHFGSIDLVAAWLRSPRKEFGGASPIDCIRRGHISLVNGAAHDIAFMVPD